MIIVLQEIFSKLLKRLLLLKKAKSTSNNSGIKFIDTIIGFSNSINFFILCSYDIIEDPGAIKRILLSENKRYSLSLSSESSI